MAKGIAFEFLDVGQGDGTLVQLPPWNIGQLWLVDFGKKSSSNVPITDAVTFLVKRITEVCVARNPRPAVPTLDCLVITHVDGDHWNRLDVLIRGDPNGDGSNLWQQEGWPQGTRLHIETLVYGGGWATYEGRNRPLADLVFTSANTKVSFPRDYAWPNPLWTIGGANIYVLSANRGNGGDANPDSVVLMFEFANNKVILTGDAESRIVEPAILNNFPPNFLKSMALKLGHHGSNASSSANWLAAVQPQRVFASGDKRWGHPYCAPFERAKQYLLTNADLHRFCCSGGEEAEDVEGDPTDYQDHNTKRGAFSNLWYVVKTDPSEKLPGPEDDGDIADLTYNYGQYFGVQWRLQIDTDGVYTTSTKAWPSPVDANLWGAAATPAGFSCRGQ